MLLAKKLLLSLLLVLSTLNASAIEGVPRIKWHNPQDLRVYGEHEVAFTGFRIEGAFEKAESTTSPLPFPFLHILADLDHRFWNKLIRHSGKC